MSHLVWEWVMGGGCLVVGLYIVSAMQSLEAKQKYLRENIPQDRYEEFSNYIEEHVGNLDIERWSQEFVVEIVTEFLKSQEQETSALETSFYHYQHANDQPQQRPESKNNETKLPQPPRQKPEQVKSKQDPPKPKQEPVKHKEEGKLPKSEADVKPKTALSLFDSVFDAANKTSKNTPNKLEIPKPSPSDGGKFMPFDSNEFWSSSNVSKTNSNGGGKQANPKADFAGFDFWSQPASKSVQEFKTGNLEPPHSSRAQPTNDRISSVMPTFEQLMRSIKEEEQAKQKDKNGQGPEKERKDGKQAKQKIPSPYQKKNYPEQRAATPAITLHKVAYDGQILLKNDFKDSIKCFPAAQRQQFKGKDLRVAVEGHEIINRTFLMPDYVMYSLRVQPINVLIQRNYEDFSRLRTILAEFYPGTKLAYLEGTSWFGSTSVDQVKRQKAMLEFFLNDLLRNREVRNSRFLEDFLTLPQHKRIKRKFEEFQRLQRPKAIEELCLLQGRVQVNVSQQQRQYQEHLKKYHERMVELLQRQEKLTQVLAEQYRAVATTLEALIDLATATIEETKRFNERVFGLEVQGVQDVFKLVRSCYAEEKKLAGFNMDLTTSTHLPFLAYEKANTQELDQLISTQQAFLRAFLKRSEAEKIDSNIPYTSDKLAPAKAGVAVESRSITVLRCQAGFFSNQVCHESKRIFQGLGSKFKELWTRTALRKQEQCLRSLDFWRSLAAPPDPILA